MIVVPVDMVSWLDVRIAQLTQEIRRRARVHDMPSLFMTISGIGSITATTLAALAPSPETFRKERDFVT